MLSIGRIAKGQGKYYLDLAREDYYLAGGEPPGRWWGKGAEQLRLTGRVEREQLAKLLYGYSPAGEPLVQNAGQPSHRPGFDLTFSPPKSVSVLWSQADSETRREVQEAHFAAVTAALDYLDQEAAFTRRGRAGSERVPAGLIVATFEHGTSRALDPQLHTHCLVMNAAVPADGRPGALAAYTLYKRKMTTGALYRAELAAQLQRRLGVECEPRRTWFELKGVPEALLQEFSKRRAAIEKKLAADGLETATAAAFAALATREVKELVPPRSELFATWQAVGRRHGFRPELLLHRPRARTCEPAQLVEQAIADITQTRDHFSEPEVLRRTAELAAPSAGGAESIRQAVHEELRRSASIVRVGKSGGLVRYTTQELLRCARAVVAVAASLAGLAYGVPRPIVERRIKALSSKRSPLAEELRHHVRQLGRAAGRRRTMPIDRKSVRQGAHVTLDDKRADMVRHLTRISRAQIRCIESAKGAEHYLTLRAVREAYEKAGYRVIGVSASRRGVEALKHEAGIVDCTTLRGLLAWMKPTLKYRVKHHAKQVAKAALGLKTQRLRPFRMHLKTVVIIDDATWLGTRPFEKLIASLKWHGGLLIFTGFPKDARLEVPTLFQQLLSAAQAAAQTLNQVKRQLAPHHSLRDLADQGLLTVSDDREHAAQDLLSDWTTNQVQCPEKSAIICDGPADVEQMNRWCQDHRRRAGLLQTGNRLQRGTGYLYQGDRVLFTKTSRLLGFRRGDTGTLIAIKPASRVCMARLDSGRTVVVPLREYPYLQLAYAVAARQAQVTALDRVYLLPSGSIPKRGVRLPNPKTRVYVTEQDAGPELAAQAARTRTARARSAADDYSSGARPRQPEPEMSRTR